MNRFIITAAMTVGLFGNEKAAQSNDELRQLFADPEPWIQANSYDEPIETDRHDFTQSPKTVGRRVGQLVSSGICIFTTTQMAKLNTRM